MSDSSTADIAAKVALNQELAKETINQLASFITDLWTYRIVVIALGMSVLVGMLGLIVLSWKGVVTLPEALVAIASAAVGALAGLLAPSPTRSQSTS